MRKSENFKPEDWTDWVLEHENEDIASLTLRYSHKKDLPAAALISQVKGRQTARKKIPTWYAQQQILYPDSLIIEQCSSEVTARMKATFARGKIIADLTGGLGIDSWAFSLQAKIVFYIEPDENRCRAAIQNFSVLGRENIHAKCSDAIKALEEGFPEKPDIIYLDPSRRSPGGKKIFRLEDSEPDVLLLKEKLLQSAGEVLIKLAPMLDISEGLRQLPETRRIDVIAWKGECRELLFHLRAEKGKTKIYCLEAEESWPEYAFDPLEELQLSLPVSQAKNYIFEPGASVRKAGCRKSICRDFGISAIHPNTQLYTGDHLLPKFPGRTFKLLSVLAYDKKTIRETLQGRAAQLVFYNFPGKPEAVARDLKIPSGEPLYLFFVTIQNGHAAVLFCERLPGAKAEKQD